MSQLGSIIIAVILSVVVVAPLSWSLAIAHRKKSYEDKIGSAEIKSRDNGAVKRMVILFVLNFLDWIKCTAIPGNNSIFYLLLHRVLLYHENEKFSCSL